MGCGEPSCAIASRCFLTSVVSGSVPAPSHPRPRPRVKHPQDSPLICRRCSHSHLQTQPPRRTAMQKLRIVTVGVSGGKCLTRPFRDVSLDKIVARAEGYTFAATVWDLSIVEGPFLPPRAQTLRSRYDSLHHACGAPRLSAAITKGRPATRSSSPRASLRPAYRLAPLYLYHANQSSIGLRIQLRQAHVLTAGVRDSASTWAKTRPSAADVRAVGWVGETGEAPHRLDTVTHATLRCVVF